MRGRFFLLPPILILFPFFILLFFLRKRDFRRNSDRGAIGGRGNKGAEEGLRHPRRYRKQRYRRELYVAAVIDAAEAELGMNGGISRSGNSGRGGQRSREGNAATKGGKGSE